MSNQEVASTPPVEAPQVVAAIRTHPGMHRSVNEDAALARYPLFLVADGMGGYEAGDQASVAALVEFDRAVTPDTLSNVQVVSNALQRAREAVERISSATNRGAGCTLTGAVIVDYEGQPHWLILNIGDSRVYLHRGSDLKQVTVDHSLRDELIAGGVNDESHLPGRNVITRALGSARHDRRFLAVAGGNGHTFAHLLRRSHLRN